MEQPVYLYGAGGHAKVIIELLEAQGREVRGLFDDNPNLTRLLGYPVAGWKTAMRMGLPMIVSIGDNAIRKKTVSLVKGPFAKTCHPNSYISQRASWGEGSVVMSGVSINSGAVIGSHCIVNTHASVDHDCSIGDFVHIAPHATLCGHVKVGDGVMVGAGAVIGAGAVVRKHIPEGVTVVGNPARIFKIPRR